MELVNPEKALSTATHDVHARSSSEPARSNPRAAEMLSRIWLAAQAVWGHKWTSSNGDLPIDDNGQLTVAAALWAEGLRGLTERQVMAALDRLAKTGSEWPPNLPELRKAAFGIPAFAAVNNEILTTTSDKRTAFARLVWSFIVDPYAYRHCSAKDAERLRRDAYEQACEHLMTGGGLPPEPAGEIAHDTAHRSLGIPKSPFATRTNCESTTRRRTSGMRSGSCPEVICERPTQGSVLLRPAVQAAPAGCLLELPEPDGGARRCPRHSRTRARFAQRGVAAAVLVPGADRAGLHGRNHLRALADAGADGMSDKPITTERTLRYALQHLANRRGQADRAELRRIYQPSDGDTIVDGLVAKGFVEEREGLDGRDYLAVTDAGARALADAEWP
jgi:hypothetical protein